VRDQVGEEIGLVHRRFAVDEREDALEPMPVSIALRGRSLSAPSAPRLYCWNTTFQNSTKRLPLFGPSSSALDA